MAQRIDSIKKHTSNVQQEHEQNQKLLTAHSNQLDSEDHLFRLCNSTSSKLSQELRNFTKEKLELTQRIEKREIEMVKTVDRLNSLKKNAKFDKDQLAQWEEALRRGQEDNQLVEKFMKTDGKKFKASLRWRWDDP